MTTYWKDQSKEEERIKKIKRILKMNYSMVGKEAKRLNGIDRRL
jgi:hypothetical protein